MIQYFSISALDVIKANKIYYNPRYLCPSRPNPAAKRCSAATPVIGFAHNHGSCL